MKTTILTILVSFVGLSVYSQQSGNLDPSFGTNGKIATAIPQQNLVATNSVLLQTDGKTVVLFNTYNSGVPQFGLARYEINGALDNSFGTNGISIINLSIPAYSSGMALLPDGKFAVILDVDGADVDNDFSLTRINANGSLDLSFGTNGIVTTDFSGRGDLALDIKVQADGKIVLAGFTADVNATLSDFAMARYLPNGSLDLGFGNNGRQRVTFPSMYKYNTLTCLAVRTDGKIVFAGTVLTPSYSSFSMVQLNTDGSFDNTFGNNGILISGISSTYVSVLDVAIQADNKILILGSAGQPVLARFNTDASLDNTFGVGGIATSNLSPQNYRFSKIAIQADGKILTGGYDMTDKIALFRYAVTGTPDASFGTSGLVSTLIGDSLNYCSGLVVQPDQKIVVGGNCSFSGNRSLALARYHSVSDLTLAETESGAVSISLYPNPVTENTVLEYTLEEPDEISITLYDTQGKKLIEYQNSISQKMGTYSLPLRLPALPSGHYFMVLTSSKGSATIQFIRQLHDSQYIRLKPCLNILA